MRGSSKLTGIVRVALQRPYTFVVMALLLLIVGPLAALRTPTDIFPEIRIPVIATAWQYTGLAPDQMSGRIGTVFQRILTTAVNDIEHIEANTYPGITVVKIFFQPGVNVATANAQEAELAEPACRHMAEPAGNRCRSAAAAGTLKAYVRANDLINQRHQGGIASGLDVARARTQLESTRSQLNQLLARRAVLEHAVAALVGANASAFTVDAKTVPGAIPPRAATWLNSYQQVEDQLAMPSRYQTAAADEGRAVAAAEPSEALAAR